jgi:hypothetical protein
MRKFTVAMLLCIHAHASSQNYPTGAVSWTVQVKEDGKLSDALVVNDLTCSSTMCWLSTVTLNLCSTGTWRPNADLFSTDGGRFSVSVVKDGLSLSRDFLSFGRTQERLRLTTHADGSMFQVVGYTGGRTYYSEVFGRMLTIEYVPLEGQFVKRKLDCPLMLPGLVLLK